MAIIAVILQPTHCIFKKYANRCPLELLCLSVDSNVHNCVPTVLLYCIDPPR